MDPQIQVASIIVILLGVLVWGRWRYDGVTLTALASMVLQSNNFLKSTEQMISRISILIFESEIKTQRFFQNFESYKSDI